MSDIINEYRHFSVENNLKTMNERVLAGEHLEKSIKEFQRDLDDYVRKENKYGNGFPESLDT